MQVTNNATTVKLGHNKAPAVAPVSSSASGINRSADAYTQAREAKEAKKNS